MTEIVAPAVVEWHVDCASGADLATLTCIDSHTGRRFSFELPFHALPALKDFITELVRLSPERFTATHTRLIAATINARDVKLA